MQPLLAEISLRAIRKNAGYFCKLTRSLIAVVKDDAYGHGAAEVAHSLHNLASSFAVATVEEGASLRIAGVQEDILVLTPPMTEEECVRLLSYGLVACLGSDPPVRLLARAAELTGITPRVHLAVNTGMNRYGYPAPQAASSARRMKRLGFSVEGVFSHYFAAEDEKARRGQDLLFSRAAADVKALFPDCICHIAATEGTLQGEGYDAARIGLGLYGYLPQGGSGPLHRAMRLYAYVSNSCRQTGEGLGYAFSPQNFGQVHTLRMGYGDGFFREGEEMAVGRLCMDATLSAGAAGFGKRVCVVSDFEAYARAHGTSVYEALVRLPSKAVRKYIL